MDSLNAVEIAEIIADTLDIDIGDDGYGAATFAELLIERFSDEFKRKAYLTGERFDMFDQKKFKVSAWGNLLGVPEDE